MSFVMSVIAVNTGVTKVVILHDKVLRNVW